MAGTTTKRACFLLLAQVVLSRAFDGLTEEPKCYSRFDYDYKLMHLVVDMERQQSDVTTTTDRLEADVKELDTTCKEKLADIRADLDAETIKTEALEQKIQELTNRLHMLITEVDSLPRWNQWTEWSACFVNCTGPSGGRLQTRTRTARDLNRDGPEEESISESETRPCNAVQFAGCVKTSSHADDEYAIVYDYPDMTAQATCTAVGSGYVRAIRRACPGSLTCEAVCKNVGTTCFNALHVYPGQPVPTRGETGTKGPMIYKYDSCTWKGCGPNFCCCKGN